MRIALISDIHGNLQALCRVLEMARRERVETVACLGDIVGYGPYPNECTDLVREKCTIVVQGNHDAGAVGILTRREFNTEGCAAIEWTRKHLTQPNQKFLKELPAILVADDITFVHASPLEPRKWAYLATWRDAEDSFNHFATTYCCHGHTHIPAVVAANGAINTFQKGQRHIINAGSVGQPRDGNPRASFAILDTELPSASIVRIAYDIEATATAIRTAGLPEFLARRLSLGI
jgi:putative phosphoesterase